jgi:hypothetical protein
MEEPNPSVQNVPDSNAEKNPELRTQSIDSNGNRIGIAKPAEWPTEPIPLIPNKTDAIVMTIYDGFLIVAPVFLLVKAGLCIIAERIESHRYNSGPLIDQGTSLTIFLIRFNSQVSLVTEIY